jgi:hypothetical protein
MASVSVKGTPSMTNGGYWILQLCSRAAVLGGSALADPPTARAEPKKWNEAGYDACAGQAEADYRAGEIDLKTFKELTQGCCILSGGKWTTDSAHWKGGTCGPQALEEQPIHPGVAPQPTEATQNPAPPPVVQNPGIAPRPGVIETLTPAPPG